MCSVSYKGGLTVLSSARGGGGAEVVLGPAARIAIELPQAE